VSGLDATADEGPIGAAEARAQLVYVQRALEATDDDERLAALGDAYLEFGHRFGFGLAYLAGLERDAGIEDGPMARIQDEGEDLFLRWLAGRRISDRADEPERRAHAARLVLGLAGPGLERIAAMAVLELPEGHPDRDVDAARDALVRSLERARLAGDAEAFALAAQPILDEELLDTEACVAVLEEGLERIGAQDDPDIRQDFLISAIRYFVGRAIERRDAGDEPGRHAWVARARPILDTFVAGEDEAAEGTRRRLLIAGLLLSVADEADAAADAFGQAADAADPTDGGGLLAAMHEARIRVRKGQDERVREVLGPRVHAFAEQYLSALSDDDIESAGSNLSDVIESLTVAHARAGDWAAALQVLELGKSLRFRHRAALRRSPAGRRLLRLEGGLYAAARNRTDPPGPRGARFDLLARGETAQGRLLEAYRRALPELPATLLDGPSVASIAAALRPGEAAVLLGMTFASTLILVVTRDDAGAPTAAITRDDWPRDRWLELFGSDQEPSWAYALADDEGAIDARAALDRLLAGVDDALAPLEAILDEHGIERVAVVPHGLLHLVPFGATAPLRARDVLLAPSIALLVDARARRRQPRVRRCVAVANPTLDLPAAAAEAAAVRAHVERIGVACAAMEGAGATRAALADALRTDTGVLHFCSHGDSDLLEPARSGLRLYPGEEVAAAASDPFEAWARDVAAWEDLPDGEGRSGDIAGLGRLVELTGENGDVTARRMQFATGVTLEGRYDDGVLRTLADVWSAGDVMVQEPLRRCQLVVLSACEAGAGGLGLGIDEYAGLPAALQLAGAGSVIATLWPVSDPLTALQVDLLYELLTAQSASVIDLPRIVRNVGERVRAMDVAEASARLERLRAATGDPMARVALEAFAAQLPGRGPHPFDHPYDWATFHVSGTGEITWRTPDGGP